MLRKRDIKSEVFIESTRRSIITIMASLFTSETKRRIISFIRHITSYAHKKVAMTL